MNWSRPKDVARIQITLEVYKAYVADLSKIGERYEGTQKLYFSLLAATVGVLGLTDAGKVLQPLGVQAIWIVAIFGMGICILWLSSAQYYSTLFAAKFHVVRELERHLPVQPYTAQTVFLSEPTSPVENELRKRVRALIRVERFIPVVFILTFLAAAIVTTARSIR